MKKTLLYLVLAGLVLLALIQLVPYGRDHTNPPVVMEPKWDSPQTRQLAVDHCFQCHSNETTWPWYSNIAPASWLIEKDVIEGRQELNFSDWSRPGELDEIVEQIQSGRMPPIQYTLPHPESALTAEQKQAFIKGLQATTGQ
jgi:hypothetical protein